MESALLGLSMASMNNWFKQLKATLHGMMTGKVRFTTVPLNLCLFKDELDIHVFLCFLCGFSVQVTSAFLIIRNNGENTEINTLRVRKNFFFYRLKFQGNHCKSCIAIFSWRVTLNYAYSPFKGMLY